MTPSFTSRDRWPALSIHRLWLREQGLQLLDFYRHARIEEAGFGALNGDGRLPDNAVADTMITARMTHVYAMADLAGVPGSAALAAHGVAGLAGALRDPEYDGWLAGPAAADDDGRKQCYLHIFVALGAATAYHAGIEDADRLLADVLQILETRFWCEDEQAFCESFDRQWRCPADYRGANSNMHGLELCLALADVLDDAKWRARALAIVERLIHDHARANAYHVVEHFDGWWREQRDFNADARDDGFYPFGVTPGHGCEWSRLLLHLEAALIEHGQHAPDWLLQDARALFDAAMRDAWQADGQPGLAYALDWDRAVSSSRRRHWTHAEALAAADALAKRTGDDRYEHWYRRLWNFIDAVFIDRDRGGWRQELDANLAIDPMAGDSKPDLYHAYQATVFPQLPLQPAIAVAIGRVSA